MTPFELAEPTSLREAVALLDPDDASVRPVAGGTALMLMMKAGVFAPSRLVSLLRIESKYSEIATSKDGALRIGAMATLAALERKTESMAAFPVLAETLLRLSNIRVRNVRRAGAAVGEAGLDTAGQETGTFPNWLSFPALGGLLREYGYESSSSHRDHGAGPERRLRIRTSRHRTHA